MAITKLSFWSWSFFNLSILLALFSSIGATASPYVNHNDDNVRKRTSAFGTLPELSPSPHPLVKRVTKVDYASGQERGKGLVQAMACSQDPNQYLAYMLHPTHGYPPSIDGMDLHGWHRSSIDYSIHLIAAILPPMGQPSMDGIFHP